MQVQAISNTKSNLNFSSKETLEKAAELVKMDDSQIRIAAYSGKRDKDTQREHHKSFLKTLYAIPIVDTLASAILVDKNSSATRKAIKLAKKAPLSTRVRAAGATAGFWAVSLTAIELYNILKKGVEVSSPKVKKFDRENPVTGLFIDIAAITIGGLLAIAGLNKWAQNKINKSPKQYKEAEKSFKEAKLLMNESALNKEIIPKIVSKVEKFASKFPTTAKMGRFALANSVWILFGAGIASMVNNSKAEQRRVEKNYVKIKSAQVEASKYIIDTLAKDNKALVKNNIALVDALKKINSENRPAVNRDLRRAECEECCDCESDRKTSSKSKHETEFEEIDE